MKSFKEFNIITEGRSKAQAEKSRQSKSNPSEWVLVNSGTDTSPFWSVRKKSGGEQSVPTRAVGPGPSKTSPESKERQNRAAAKSGNQKTAPEKKETEKKPNWYNTGPEPDKEKSEAPKKRPDVGIPEKDWDKQKEKNKKAPKKPSDEVRCLGSGCPGTPFGPGEGVPLDGRGNPIAKKPASKSTGNQKKSGYVSGPFKGKSSSTSSKGSGGSKAFGMRDVKVNDSKSTVKKPVKSIQGGGKEPFIKKSTSTSAASASASQIKKRSRTAPYRRDAKTIYHQQRK